MDAQNLIDLAIAYAPVVERIIELPCLWVTCVLLKHYYPILKMFIKTDC